MYININSVYIALSQGAREVTTPDNNKPIAFDDLPVMFRLVVLYYDLHCKVQMKL